MIARLFVMLWCIAMLVGCGGGSEDAPRQGRGATQEKVLKVNIGANPRTLDPNLATTIPDTRVIHALMEGLVRLDENNVSQPLLAESWEVSDDSKVFTFALRKDARWHNGDPVVASDFVYGIQRVLTGALAAEYASMVAPLLEGGAEYYAAGGLNSELKFTAVEAIDDHTLIYRLANPSPFFINLVSFPTWFPVNRAVVEAHGDNWANSETTFVGNGPFRLTRYAPGNVIVTERFADYWNAETIFWDKIELYMIASESTLNAAYLSGDIDVTNTVAVAEVPFWREKPDYRVVPGMGIYYMALNTTAAPFDNVNVRKAFSKAIDRKLIVDRITRRGERVAKGFVPATVPGVAAASFRDTAGDLIGERSVEEAKQLLASYQGTLPPVEYLFNVLDEHRMIAEQAQGMWREALGVDVRLQQMEFSTLKNRLVGGDYQIARAGWIGDYVDPLTFLELFITGGSSNDPKYSNPRYDELVESARREGDLAKREQLFAEAERILIQEDAVVIPIYDYVYAFLVKPDIEGLTMNSLAAMDFVRSRRGSSQ